MRDAINIIGLEVMYHDEPSKVHSIQFVPAFCGMYITLKCKNNTFINIPYEEGYTLIKTQINKL